MAAQHQLVNSAAAVSPWEGQQSPRTGRLACGATRGPVLPLHAARNPPIAPRGANWRPRPGRPSAATDRRPPPPRDHAMGPSAGGACVGAGQPGRSHHGGHPARAPVVSSPATPDTHTQRTAPTVTFHPVAPDRWVRVVSTQTHRHHLGGGASCRS
ncbi:hypothetical protein N7461_000835 [Penicillium sp. DV-2018c]|nr:hypothetical protein N7461_000835 [Penicillium sp. DV-2018c]